MNTVGTEATIEDTCPICMESLPDGTTRKITQAEDIQETDVKVQLACNHVFCGPCIKSWVDIKPECPLCRHKVETLNLRNAPSNLNADSIMLFLFQMLHRDTPDVTRVHAAINRTIRAELLLPPPRIMEVHSDMIVRTFAATNTTTAINFTIRAEELRPLDIEDFHARLTGFINRAQLERDIFVPVQTPPRRIPPYSALSLFFTAVACCLLFKAYMDARS